jgi:drug/metabolite transporter (DMT)-like permease
MLSAWLFREQLKPVRLLGVTLSLCGAAIVIGRGDLPALMRAEIGSGEWMLLGCVGSWVLYTLIGRRLLRRLSPLVTVTYASVAGTLMLGVLVIVQGGIDQSVLTDTRSLLGIGYLAVFGTALAFVWYYRGVQAVGAARAAQFINLVPVSGVLLGALVLGEPLTLEILLGGSLVVAGLLMTNRGPVKPAG